MVTPGSRWWVAAGETSDTRKASGRSDGALPVGGVFAALGQGPALTLAGPEVLFHFLSSSLFKKPPRVDEGLMPDRRRLIDTPTSFTWSGTHPWGTLPSWSAVRRLSLLRPPPLSLSKARPSVVLCQMLGDGRCPASALSPASPAAGRELGMWGRGPSWAAGRWASPPPPPVFSSVVRDGHVQHSLRRLRFSPRKQWPQKVLCGKVGENHRASQVKCKQPFFAVTTLL